MPLLATTYSLFFMFLFISSLPVSLFLCFPPHSNPSLNSLMPPQIVPCNTSLLAATWSQCHCKSTRYKSCKLTPLQRHHQSHECSLFEGMGPIPQKWKGVCENGTAFNSSQCNT